MDGGDFSRAHAWKPFIQTYIADSFQISVTMCHYPPETSKWNPIEHRLFSEIGKNWLGKPLSRYEILITNIQTTTKTELIVKAELVEITFLNGIKIPEAELDQLVINKHATLPKWNYTIEPR